MDTVSYNTNCKDYQICSLFAQSLTEVASVFIARHTPSKTLVAYKRYDVDQLSAEDARLVQDEAVLMRQLNHPAILPLLSSFVADHKVVCILPLMGYGSSADVLLRHFSTGLPEQAIATIIKTVLQALVYLHSKGIIHRAVRGSHVLISAEGNVVLTGLRYACPVISAGRWQKKMHSYPASIMAPNVNWLSPELLKQNVEGYDERSDIYSVGITACELANGIAPYQGVEKTLMLIEKVQGIPRPLMDSSTYIPRGPIDGDATEGDMCQDDDDYSAIIRNRTFSNSFHHATELCLEMHDHLRPHAKDLLTHSFFKNAPPPAALPRLLYPAMPILQDSLPDNQEDLDSLMVSEKMYQMDLDNVSWDF
ncbi:STYKc [Nesidiocoris tenuis]|uniref:STYKc n=1 Tax=Nesidiocoris tenuis TaxID=355587 RepID=A0ABN7ABH8_9HEMI|nr:STYKc [Nesidiocoris tenuis]